MESTPPWDQWGRRVTHLRHDHGHTALTKDGGFAAHVGTRDDQNSWLGAQGSKGDLSHWEIEGIS